MNASGIHFSLPLDERPGPASRISRTRAANIVDAVMSFETRSHINLKRPPPRRKAWHKVPLLAAAALVVPLTVIAGAVRLVGIRRVSPDALFAPVRTSSPSRETGSGPRTSGTESRPSVAIPQPTTEEAPALATDLRMVVDEAAPPAAEAPQVKAIAPRHPLAAPSATPQATPEDMLRNANDLRARHQWLAATQLYEKTLRAYPGRAEAYSAMVAAGVLRLDQLGDAQGALSLFSSAIRARPRGPLSEEARWGSVQAHRSLGDATSEQTALQEFVTVHPDSLLAARARARLHELRGDPTSP